MNNHPSLATTSFHRGLALLDTLVLVGTTFVLLAIVSVLAGAIGGGAASQAATTGG